MLRFLDVLQNDSIQAFSLLSKFNHRRPDFVLQYHAWQHRTMNLCFLVHIYWPWIKQLFGLSWDRKSKFCCDLIQCHGPNKISNTHSSQKIKSCHLRICGVQCRFISFVQRIIDHRERWLWTRRCWAPPLHLLHQKYVRQFQVCLACWKCSRALVWSGSHTETQKTSNAP